MTPPARPSVVLVLLLLVVASASALQQLGSTTRGMIMAHHRGHIARAAAIRMLDPSLAADTSAAISTSLDPTSPTYDPHVLSNLGSDLWQTAIVAWVGLMGAYVTQVRHDK